jgi:pilus assembly protein CpaE
VSNEPFIVAVISPDRTIHDSIASALDGNTDIATFWSLAEYPDSAKLEQIRQATGGCIIFLDFSDTMRARAIAAELDSSFPMATTIAVHPAKRPHELIELMQLGIREVLPLPIVNIDLVRAFTRVGRKLRAPVVTEREGGNVYAFLPAKPGSGATTLAAHGAAAASRLANERSLLIDFDFRLGMTSFLFKLHGDYSVLDAIASGGEMDTDLWDRMVCRRDMLEILGSAPVEFGSVNPEDGAIRLLEFAQRAYQTICVDLPGEMREYEIETLHRAKECFLVLIPDLGTLHMAKRKSEMLRELGLQAKSSVIMNRFDGRGAMALRDVESILQLPVRFTVPVADKEIAEATQQGKTLHGRSSLVVQIEQIGRRMVPSAAPVSGSKARRFIEMFSVTPVRDRARWGS